MRNFDSFTASFYIRLNKNKRRDYSIYCCIKIARRSTELCIVNSIQKNEWEAGKARPKQESDYLTKLAIHLDSIKARLFEIYMELKLSGGECTARKVKDIYLGRESQQLTFLQLIDKAIGKYKNELAKGSLKNYYATRTYVSAFCKLKYKSGDIFLRYLNYNFIDELKTYMLENPLKPNDPCTNNGCMKHMERVKKIINWAYEMRFIDRNVFASFKIRKKPSDPIRLTWEQLKKIEQKEFYQPMVSLVRDLFIFSCYTGIAPCDLQRLKPNQIYVENGTNWMTYQRIKSEVEANVPLLNVPIALVRKYTPDKTCKFRDTVFPVVSNKDLNQNLKVISEYCELGFSLNFYTARHTFATTVALANGISITSIKSMMGHSKIGSTMRYARIDKSMVSKEMMFLQSRMDLLMLTNLD